MSSTASSLGSGEQGCDSLQLMHGNTDVQITHTNPSSVPKEIFLAYLS